MTAINPDAPHNAQEVSVEVIVARTVAAIFARVVAADEGVFCTRSAGCWCLFSRHNSGRPTLLERWWRRQYATEVVRDMCGWGAVAQQWQGEVDLLQKRMARMARMEEAIERQRLRERAARDTVQRRLLHGALAVCTCPSVQVPLVDSACGAALPCSGCVIRTTVFG